MVAISELDERVLRLAAEGFSTAVIAAALGATRAQIEASLDRLYERSGTRNRAELAAWWARQGGE